MGNYKDSKLEVLANRGKGNFAYLDNEKEAEKVLMEEFAQTIYAVAKDAYVNIRFDPSVVKSYRLIGFDNKLNAMSDTSNIIQGGEIGSGHTLMALVEIEPVPPGSGADSNASSFAKVSLHYELPSQDTMRLEEYKVPYRFGNFSALPRPYRFATSVALFGGLLKKSRFTEKTSWEDLVKMATESYDPNDVSQKEYILMIEKAKKIYHKNRKKKKVMDVF